MTDDPIRQDSQMLDDLDALLASPPETGPQRMVAVIHPRQWDGFRVVFEQALDKPLRERRKEQRRAARRERRKEQRRAARRKR